MRSTEENKDIERAIVFMVKKIDAYCSNPKPLILHCIRVGMQLWELPVPKEVAMAGFLHDLLEDTKCTKAEISRDFGKEVTELVLALTFDITIKDYKKRWHKAVDEILRLGRNAMMIKVIDIRDNLQYLGILFPKRYKTEEVLWKHNLILESFKPYLHNWKDYTLYERELRQKEKEFQASIKK